MDLDPRSVYPLLGLIKFYILTARPIPAGLFFVLLTVVGKSINCYYMQEIVKYSGCFICGDNNDIGLKARFYFDGDKAHTETVAERRFEGYADIYHGGITSALLDEVMIKALLARDIYVMTVELLLYQKSVSQPLEPQCSA